MGGASGSEASRSTGELSHVACAGLAAASALLVWLAFPPVDFGAAAWVALVPLLLLVAKARLRRVALWAFPAYVAVFVALAHWLRYVTIAGWIALAFYCALYWLAFVLVLGWMKRRGLPLYLTTPLLFTSLEFIRATALTGFPFFLLAHTQYRYLPVIQIADVVGTYGITFVIAAVNGAIAHVLIAREMPRRQRFLPLAVAGGLLLATLGYGVFRIQTTALKPGITVTLVQGNIPQDLKHSTSREDLYDLLEKHVRLTESISEKTDLVIWAETMFPAPLNLAFDTRTVLSMITSPNEELSEYGKFATRCRAEFLRVVRSAGVPFLVGSETYNLEDGSNSNSAYLVSSDGRVLGQYHKMHLVVFGEYTPWTNLFPFLRVFRPEVMGPDLTPGRLPTLFQAPLNGGMSPKFGVTICYEDAESGLFRRFVRDGARFMLNITNDGWFRNSTELDEHLAVCAFRAVENRVPIARCTNTGISGIISPTGKIAERLVDSEGRDRDIEGTLTGPLMMTDARAVYTRIGDLFAAFCVGGSGLLVLAGFLQRRHGKVERK
jgi:apolipoprotein N-acyltransferase